jgi:C4-type Zn-finger protein
MQSKNKYCKCSDPNNITAYSDASKFGELKVHAQVCRKCNYRFWSFKTAMDTHNYNVYLKEKYK